MSSPATRNWRKIREAFEFLKNERRPIRIRIEGEETPFISKIIKAEHGDALFIEVLRPQKGNELIQTKKPLTVGFSIGKCEYEVKAFFVRKSVISPYFGHIISYPGSIQIVNRRRHNRYERDTLHAPLFLDATLTFRTGQRRNKIYDLKVFDLSEQGVGILAGEDMQEFLQAVDLGCRVEELELLAAWMTVKVAGTVKHKSRIREGKYTGCYHVGVQLDERLEHCV